MVVFVVFFYRVPVDLGKSQGESLHSPDLTHAPYKQENHFVHVSVHMRVCACTERCNV